MPEIETRLPCPTCLGVVMEKLKPVKDHDLVLDYCTRCGGIWFDAGEVQLLRQIRPRGLPQAIELRETAFKMPCHSCHAPMDRNADKCTSCGWENRLECPSCQKQLERIERDDLVLDVCRSCRGVWFDNHEIAQIWNMEVRRNLPTVKQRDGSVSVADYFLLDALLWAPDLVFLSGYGVARGAGAIVGAASEVGVEGVAAAAGGAIEGVGEVAGSVFEVIAEIIGSIFG